jgi:hypothetical protein
MTVGLFLHDTHREPGQDDDRAPLTICNTYLRHARHQARRPRARVGAWTRFRPSKNLTRETSICERSYPGIATPTEMQLVESNRDSVRMSAVLRWDVSSVPGCRVKTEGSHRTTYVMSALSNIYEVCAVNVCKKFEQRTTPELGRASMHSMGIGIKGALCT